MALLDLIEVSKQFQTQKILEKINLFIDEGERIAIIGKNGGGKSTLMKIINNSLNIDSGRRIAKQGLIVDMLSQNPNLDESLSVKEAIKKELKELNQARIDFEINSKLLSLNPQNIDYINEQARLSNFLDMHNAWNLDDRIQRVMQEFALKIFENTLVSNLSGGEKRRVALASLILKKPDILLLDEPTNHLDVYMVSFLEEMLLKGNFTIIFISHDRYFIDRLATRSIEIDNLKINSFKGGYSQYLHEKNLLLESMKKQYDNTLKHLKQEEEWLRKGVRARLKRDEGRKERLMKLRVEAKRNPAAINKMKLEIQRASLNFNQEKSINRQKMLFEVKDLNKNIANKTIIKNFTTRILQKDRIAIVGKNGSGKSTFLQLLLGNLKTNSGEIKRGDFQIGYFDQERLMLNDDKSLIETFCPNGGDRVMVRGKNMHVFGYLKNFLFPKEFLDKKIGILSGGEKNRVALALLFTKEVECLMLDEPTNDLDIPTINILEEYIQSFEGAVIFVSHDRYFVDKIAKKLFIFKGEGEIVESYQSYTEFLEFEKEFKEYDNLKIEGKLEENTQKEKTKPTKLSYKDKLEYEKLPQEIDELENEVKKIKNCLGNPDCYKELGLSELALNLEKTEKFLEEKIEKFLEIEEKIEKLN